MIVRIVQSLVEKDRIGAVPMYHPSEEAPSFMTGPEYFRITCYGRWRQSHPYHTLLLRCCCRFRLATLAETTKDSIILPSHLLYFTLPYSTCTLLVDL